MTKQADRIQNAIRHIKSSVDIDPWAMGIAVEAMEKELKNLSDEQSAVICGACDNSESDELYLTNPPKIKCKRSGKLHFVTDRCDLTPTQPKPDEKDHLEQGDLDKLGVKTGETCADAISRQDAIDALSTPHGILYPIRTVEKLPSVQPEERTDKRTETHGVCLDVIDRQAAIDAILAVTGNSSVRELYEHVQEHGLSEMWSGGVNAAIDIIIALPSAEPEQRWETCFDCPLSSGCPKLRGCANDQAVQYASEIPADCPLSAQPEPLTDKEQRIFLAAMGREEKVCEEVDRNHVREPYEDSLMSVCREVKRKVKGALWT